MSLPFWIQARLRTVAATAPLLALPLVMGVSAPASHSARVPKTPDRCYFRDLFPNVKPYACHGYAPDEWDDRPKHAQKLATWIVKRGWGTASEPIERETGAGGILPKFTIAAIDDAPRIDLTELGDRGLVVAHIVADPAGTMDARYHIGKQTDPELANLQLTRDFFIAIDRYDEPGTIGNDGIDVSTWHVYGVDVSMGKPRLVYLKRSGPFRWCMTAHDRNRVTSSATFITCADLARLSAIASHPEVAAALAGRPLLDVVAASGVASPLSTDALTQRFQSLLGADRETPQATITAWVLEVQQILAAQKDAPAWMICGIGCCTADA